MIIKHSDQEVYKEIYAVYITTSDKQYVFCNTEDGVYKLELKSGKVTLVGDVLDIVPTEQHIDSIQDYGQFTTESVADLLNAIKEKDKLHTI